MNMYMYSLDAFFYKGIERCRVTKKKKKEAPHQRMKVEGGRSQQRRGSWGLKSNFPARGFCGRVCKQRSTKVGEENGEVERRE